MLKKFKLAYLLSSFFIALALLAGCGGGGGGGGEDETENTIFTTAQGDLQCVDEGNMIACRGIPYAKPPVGDLRFVDPQPLDGDDNWTGTRNAASFGASCPQGVSGFSAPGPYSEDCLFLNVFIPTGTEPGDDLPVMVWIHGGAFIYGGSSTLGYDKPALVNEGVIVVTINYRLGVLGFMSHASLDSGGIEPLAKIKPMAMALDYSGNYGLKDQERALRWVQDNIANFGGDSENITIFGESAGGHSVLSLLAHAWTIPATLFHKAIVQSGTYHPNQINYLAARVAWYNSMVETLCPAATYPTSEEQAACLRGKSVADILTAQGSLIPLPTTASSFLPYSIADAISGGQFADVPLIIGSNKHEGYLFAMLGLPNPENSTVYSIMANTFLEQFGYNIFILTPTLETIRDTYLSYAVAVTGDDPSPFYVNRYRVAYGMMYGDRLFNCPNLQLWGALSSDRYGYWFTDEQAPNLYEAAAAAFLPLGIGAIHTLEIQYVFGTVGASGGSTAQIELSNKMIRYWTRFAKTGNPNGGTDPAWPSLGPTSEIMKLDDDGPTAVDIYGNNQFNDFHHCDFWGLGGLGD